MSRRRPEGKSSGAGEDDHAHVPVRGVRTDRNAHDVVVGIHDFLSVAAGGHAVVDEQLRDDAPRFGGPVGDVLADIPDPRSILAGTVGGRLTRMPAVPDLAPRALCANHESRQCYEREAGAAAGVKSESLAGF